MTLARKLTHITSKTVYRLLAIGITLCLLASCTNAPATSTFPSTPPVTNGPTAPGMIQSPLPSSTTQNIIRSPAATTQTATQLPSPSSTSGNNPAPTSRNVNAHIKTVFIILMENHNWSDILNSPSAPYINNILLPQASYAQQYYNPPGVHPSTPNYLWLEAGTSFGITSDGTPSEFHQSTTDHLVTYLNNAGITWKSYQEDIGGKSCPLKNSGLYIPRHNPMVFFDDVTGSNNPDYAYCISHERPYTELQTDLTNGKVAKYNFITPNLCDDMHNSTGCPSQDEIKNGDTWLSEQVPMILASDAYKQGGVIFITWDESEGGNNPIGMIVLSQFAKGGGYSNTIHYTHSSTLRTIQEIFNVTPLLGDAANATDLSDLFKEFP